MILLLVAAAVLACSGAVAAAVHDDDGSTATAAGPALTTTTSVPAETTTTALAPTTTTTPAPSTTVRRTTTTAVRRVAVGPTTTQAPAAATSTTVGAKPACTPAQIEVTAAADAPSYGPAQQVAVTSTLRNRSTTPCSYRSFTFQVEFVDPAGQPWDGATAHADSPLEDVIVSPGDVLTQTAHWDHQICTTTGSCKPQPAGTYTARVQWSFAGVGYDRTASVVLL